MILNDVAVLAGISLQDEARLSAEVGGMARLETANNNPGSIRVIDHGGCSHHLELEWIGRELHVYGDDNTASLSFSKTK